MELLLDLASYSIVEESNVAQHYPDYAYNHPLYSSGMKIYSDASVSDFFKSITKDKSTGFLNEWNAKRNRRERIYISYDSTNKNCQAGEIELAEFDHAKTDIGSVIINYSVGYDLKNKEPLFYEAYPESINNSQILFKGKQRFQVNNQERKTKPELWKQIEELEQKLWFMEKILETKGLLVEAEDYVEKAIQDTEELPFD